MCVFYFQDSYKILIRWEALNIVALRALEAVNPLLAEGRERVYIIRRERRGELHRAGQ